MKPALHRSITFWSGLLVIGFIAWAWWDSTQYSSAAVWLGPGKSSNWRADNNDGAVFLSRTRHMDRAKPLPWGIKNSWTRFPMGPDSREGMHSRLGSRPFAYIRNETPMGPTTYVFEFWILTYRAIILPPLAIWIALLLWRARRRKRAATTNAMAI